jgi:hypothetical protein
MDYAVIFLGIAFNCKSARLRTAIRMAQTRPFAAALTAIDVMPPEIVYRRPLMHLKAVKQTHYCL